MTADGESEQVLVFAPHGRDAELTCAVLAKHEIDARVCADAAELATSVEKGAGCAIVTAESLARGAQRALAAVVSVQPPWSDFPLLMLTDTHYASRSQAIAVELGNVTVIERPVAPHTLVTAVRAALRTRRRQYEARAAIRQRDQFLAMLGHELRNPLGAIVLASELVRRNPDRTQLDDRLALIEHQANLLARLVDDLLDVARVTSGKVRLRREAVDIDGTISACIAALGDHARARAITLVHAATSGAIIEGDLVRIEQVLNNLVSNAIKYSPAGRTVSVSSKIVDTICELRVRDQGIGIAPEMQARVFDLFAQADGSLERSDGGMGIGLTLVDRLVRLHGGTVEVVSAGLGRGCELIVRLPIGAPPQSRNLFKLESARGVAKLTVVLVEDNPDLRALTAELLAELGCSVSVAIDGPEGLDQILRTRPELAIIDIGLPLMDGFTVAQEVRARIGERITLVALTGYGRDQDREQALAAGFDLHLTKPMSVDQLRDIVERARAERTTQAAPSTGA